MIKIAQPVLGDEEISAVHSVLESGNLASGPVVRDLEAAFARDLTATSEAVAVNSGTAALHLALLAHDIGPGDEVITSPFTFQAAANMVLATGARPVFVDIAEDGNLDPSLIAPAVTPKTRAILPVHLFGRICDMEAIGTIAQERGLALIEDAAQAHGASICGRQAGSFGSGCFSFYATKNMTAGEGGMVTTNNHDLAERIQSLRSHGESERYHSVELGFNYRMTDIAAAIALAQLNKLPVLTERRRRNAEFLTGHLLGVTVPPAPVEPGAHVWHQYTIRVQTGRDDLFKWLRDRDIESGIYYQRPLPDHKLYQDLGFSSADLPVTRRLAAEALSLPVHPALSRADLEQIVEAVNAWAASSAPAGG